MCVGSSTVHWLRKWVLGTGLLAIPETNLLGWVFLTFLKEDQTQAWMISKTNTAFGSVQFSCSVVSDFLRPYEPKHARPPCPSQLLESTQTHVHRVDDAIQPSYPLSSPFPPALNLSQHQGLFQWVSSSHQVAKVLQFQPQHQSFQWTHKTGLL